MKLTGINRHAHGERGFTLAELLVALAAILLLCLILLASISSISPTTLRSSKRIKAQNMANQLQTAALNYYTEYSEYPGPSGVTKDYVLTDSDAAVNCPSGAWGPLVECLSGMIKPSTGELSHEALFTNTRSIAFLSLKSTDVVSGGPHQDAPLNPLPPNATSLYFNFAVDSDGDGLLGDPKTSSAGLLPSFDPPTKGAPLPMTGSCKDGVAVWANCNPSDGTQSSGWWVHTY